MVMRGGSVLPLPVSLESTQSQIMECPFNLIYSNPAHLPLDSWMPQRTWRNRVNTIPKPPGVNTAVLELYNPDD